MSGLHNLVEGLSINSPTSPTNSTNNLFSGSPPPIYGGQDSEYVDGNSTPGSAAAASSSASVPVPRLHSVPLSSRRQQQYGMASPSGSSPSPSRKEVSKTADDLTLLSTPGDRLNNTIVGRSPGTASPMTSSGSASKPLAYKGSDYLRLEDFLYTRGFLEGACSDIVVIAFGTQYKLHRLILDRSPYFSCLFNGPWVETSSSEIKISPEDTDPNITKKAFDLALARLYGRVDRVQEEAHALSVLAAACFLDLQDLAESCVNSILHSMTTDSIAKTIRFVTASYYGNHGDRILGSAKALLYRDGYEMPPAAWDGISGEIVAEIAGYDGFYVPSELQRYLFVKDMLNHRLSQLHGIGSRQGGSAKGKQKSLGTRDSEETLVEKEGVDFSNDEDIRPLKDLLENGIYYLHLSFEELQRISEDYDVTGKRIVSEQTIRNALWQQMLLRQKVVNAPLNLPELGITQTMPLLPGTTIDDAEDEARKALGGDPIYLVPTEDSTTIIAGDHTDAGSHNNSNNSRNSGLKNSLNDATATLRLDSDDVSTPREDSFEPKEIRYSRFPPFRFSAEFRSIKTLREKKRVYSKTVFYAGSHWNIYIQKVKPGKSVQLGVYLHRAKERDPDSVLMLGNSAVAEMPLQGNPDLSYTLHSARNSTQYHGDAGEEDGSSGGEAAAALGTTTQPNTSAPRWASGTGTAQANPAAASVSPVPTVATYTDSRPMIQTYFKIFSPSKKGKVLSMFSSEPDSFNFSQSWGWKSSTLILDEAGGLESEEGKLRFMVVLGNV